MDSRLTPIDTENERIKFLEKLDYQPDGGYVMDKILNLGDFAVIMVKVLRLQFLLPRTRP